MAFEYEQKFVYKVPDQKAREILGYQNLELPSITQTHITSFFEKYGILVFNEHNLTQKDRFFLPSNNIDLSLVQIILDSSVINKSDEYCEFKEEYFKRITNNSLEDYEKQLRFRSSSSNSNKTSYFLTLKDSNSPKEYEVQIKSPFIEFSSLFYELKNKSKSKKQKKYVSTFNGYNLALEFNTISDLNNTTFFEIELLSRKENPLANNLIETIAKEFEIREPSKNTRKGGLREDRGFYSMQKLFI